MGGDLNFDPVDNMEETSLRELGKVMVNTAEEFSNSSHWWRASYGDPANSYSGEHRELTLDYIYIRANRPHHTITTLHFDVSKIVIEESGHRMSDRSDQVPLLTTTTGRSFSDHEAVSAQLLLERGSSDKSSTAL